MHRILWFALPGTLVILIFVGVRPNKQPKSGLSSESAWDYRFKACRQAAQCVRAETSCSCTAINKELRGEYEEELSRQKKMAEPYGCPGRGIDPACGVSAQASCINGRCRLCYQDKGTEYCQ